MDDLAGLDWSSSSSRKPTTSRPLNPPGTGNYYQTLRPTPPPSGTASPFHPPLSKSPSGSNVPSRTITPANDSFANLFPTNTAQANKNLSLQEQQRRLQEQKELDRRKAIGVAGQTINGDGLDQLGSGRTTPSWSHTSVTSANTQPLTSQRSSIPPSASSKQSTSINSTSRENDDLLGAFSTKPPGNISNRNARQSQVDSVGNDDDPFGLGIGASRPRDNGAQTAYNADGDDDLLGLLGKPVSELPPRKEPSPQSRAAPDSNNPQAQALAELVDMGFPADKAQEALETTESGVDVQVAVGWLLNQAHAESKSKPHASPGRGREASIRHDLQRQDRAGSSDSAPLPVWMRQSSRGSSAQRRQDNSSPANGERDAAKMAAQIGGNLLKSANSLWKTSQKKLNRAVADFNSEPDREQPKWMREAGRAPQVDLQSPDSTSSIKSPFQDQKSPDMTDEAMLLESGAGRPETQRRNGAQMANGVDGPSRLKQDFTQSIPFRASQSQKAPTQGATQSASFQSNARLTRQTLEDEQTTAYVSPGRHKRAPVPATRPEDSLLVTSSQASVKRSISASHTSSNIAQRPRTQPRPKAPSRIVPPVSSVALKSSNQHRAAGAASFKLGNYAAATEFYTAALSPLPPEHPIAIIVLTNRALTHLKTGNPKASIADSESALSIIGSSRGAGEVIEVGEGEGKKDMTQFWGRATMRKAEALEQLERWNDAATVWRECVSAGVGGATSISSRNRCEKAAGGSISKPTAPAPRPNPDSRKPTPRTKASMRNDLHAQSSMEAVARLRAANAAADKVDDEKFALSESVDARLSAWRKGKEDNLRALLGSLDTVLWEGSGWKKISMADLIIPGKVKIQYMKGIAKVHPDKLPQSATTEQIMISQAVFATLNEAWDKFKRENGL